MNRYNLDQNNSLGDDEVSIFDGLEPLPAYYSEKAIYVLTVLFGLFFGAVLMAINFKNTAGKKGIWEVLAFGLLFSIAEGMALKSFDISNTGLTFLLNGGGAYVLNNFFWNRYIGKNAPYMNKSVLFPTMIACLLAILLFLAYMK